MSLTLKANTLAIGPLRSTSFAGSGGTEPYVYSVTAGGAGGTINSSTGLYTAPATVNEDPKKAYDTIVVTDADAATASLQILVGNALALVCDIIAKEMSLDSTQVYLWDQKINIPKDSRLYVAIGVMSCKPFGNTCSFNSGGEGLQAVQSVNMLARLDINILSRGPAARDRKEEIVLALGSVYAEQQQELNSFLVGKLPQGFTNLSQEDGAAIPYRFNIAVNLQYSYRKAKASEYFDDFSDVEIDTQS